MKKSFLVLVLVLFFIDTALAQKKVGQLSFIPRVGLNLSNIGNADICYINYNGSDGKQKSSTLPDFMIGADVEYQVQKSLGVSLGAFYSRQGCRWSTYYTKDSETKETGFEDQSMKLQYVNIPLTANYYVTDFFSLHAGLQCGVNVGGTYDYNMCDVTLDSKTGARTYGTSDKYHTDVQNLNSLVWSIPLGISVEYEKVIVDARYNIPLSNYTSVTSGGNRVWTISVGYRL